MKARVSAFVSSVFFCIAASLPAGPAQAQDSCELYDTTGEIVDVFKEPNPKGKYFELLERGDVTCISAQKQNGSTTWGFITYRKDKNGQKVTVNGWVDLQFVAPQSGATPAATARQPEQPSAPTKSASPEDPQKAEVAYWNTVRDSRDPDLIQMYLNTYPNGTFAALATAMIAKLQPATVTSPTAEQAKAYVPATTQTKRKSTKKKKAKRTTTRKKSTTKKRAKKTTKKKKTERRASRRPAKKCRYETVFECMRRGERVDKLGDCNVRWICR
ncbi:MAG: hypothetical protein AAF346_11545 [Pseudomonadota bacterium]